MYRYSSTRNFYTRISAPYMLTYVRILYVRRESLQKKIITDIFYMPAPYLQLFIRTKLKKIFSWVQFILFVCTWIFKILILLYPSLSNFWRNLEKIRSSADFLKFVIKKNNENCSTPPKILLLNRNQCITPKWIYHIFVIVS